MENLLRFYDNAGGPALGRVATSAVYLLMNYRASKENTTFGRACIWYRAKANEPGCGVRTLSQHARRYSELLFQ
jgi:hypothetical protein